MSVAKAAFTEELAVCHSDGAMKKRMALTARASVNGEGGSAAVGVSNGISNRHEAKVFDVVAGKQTECGGIGKACDGVEEIRGQEIIEVESEVLIGRTHDGEVSEEIVGG